MITPPETRGLDPAPPVVDPAGAHAPVAVASEDADRELHLCVRCARHRRTCCQTSEIHVTPGDVERIASHTGRSDFTTRTAPVDPTYLEQGDDPLWLEHVFARDGTRRVLVRQANGDCTFLGASGCTLPGEVRPLVCRIYPYDYTAAGLRSGLSPGCPLELVRPGESLLDELGMTDDAPVRRWRARLYEEILLERRTDAHWHDV